MSRTEVTQITPSKLLSGGGDGVPNGALKPDLKTPRTPVPSCRRFAVRPQRRDETIKHKLEKALEEQQNKAPGPTRRPKLPRRSATMAEITPSKTRPNKTCRLKAPPGGVSASATATDAGRRVYDQLLLNAWRRRREQVATLTDSSRRLQEQVEQLQRQIEVLRDLRKSEGRRRSEAACESNHLRASLEKQQEKCELLSEEKQLVENCKEVLEKRVEELRTEVENAKNDTLAMRSELRMSEQQLNKEREKIGKLRKERDSLMGKVANCEKIIAEQREKLRGLQESLHNTENNLQTVLLSCTTAEDAKNAILRQLEAENQLCSSLQTQLAQSNSSLKTLQEKIVELKENLVEIQEAKKSVSDENSTLRSKVQELQDTLCAERRRSWWKNAGELAMAPLTALQNAAFVMLPALPHSTAKATSTTDFLSNK